MACECGQPLTGTAYRHLAGCPSARSEERAIVCQHCGKKYNDELELFYGICMDCLEKAYTVESALAYIKEDLQAFFEWDQGIKYDDAVDPVPISVKLYGELIRSLCSPISCERKQAEASLREYCLGDPSYWAEFVEREELL